MSLDSVLYIRKSSSDEHVINLVEIYASPLIHNWFMEYIDDDGRITFLQLKDMHKVCTEVLNTTAQRQETATNVRYVYGKGHHITEYTCPFVVTITYPTLTTLELCKKIFPNEHIDSAKGNYTPTFFCGLQKIKQAFETIFFLADSNNKMEEEYSICYSQF